LNWQKALRYYLLFFLEAHDAPNFVLRPKNLIQQPAIESVSVGRPVTRPPCHGLVLSLPKYPGVQTGLRRTFVIPHRALIHPSGAFGRLRRRLRASMRSGSNFEKALLKIPARKQHSVLVYLAVYQFRLSCLNQFCPLMHFSFQQFLMQQFMFVFSHVNFGLSVCCWAFFSHPIFSSKIK
jgi:hypothetical protein